MLHILNTRTVLCLPEVNCLEFIFQIVLCVCVVDAAPEDAAVSMSLSIPGLEDVSQSICV